MTLRGTLEGEERLRHLQKHQPCGDAPMVTRGAGGLTLAFTGIKVTAVGLL